MNITDNKNRQKRANWLGVLFLVQTALSLGLSGIISAGLGENLPDMLVLSLAEIVMIVPALFYVFCNKLSWKEDLGFKKIKLSTAMLAIVVTMLTSPITAFVNILSQFVVPNTMTQASDALMETAPAIIIILYAGVLAPILEETCFRGVFARGFLGIATPIKAVIASGLLFALFHLNLNQMAYALVLGIIFAIVNIASGSIITSVICHVLINSYNMILIYALDAFMKLSGEESTIAQSTEAIRQQKGIMVVYLVIYGAFSVGAFFLLRLCIRSIAKIEGNLDAYDAIFKKKGSAGIIATDSIESEAKLKVESEVESEAESKAESKAESEESYENCAKELATEMTTGNVPSVRLICNIPMIIGVLGCVVVIIMGIFA